ncbi:MAG: sigma-70 family RNA polymerase sigma factor [bacterium]
MNTHTRETGKEYTDLELFEEIASKQTWALEAIYDRHAGRLNGLAIKILKDDYLAEEVLQEVFLTIWNDPSRFNRSKGSPLAWMMILCRNKAIDKLRAKETAVKRSAILNEDILFQDEVWAADNPLQETHYRELQTRIRGALAQLPSEQRLAIEMTFFQGFSQTEISEQLNLPLGTIKTRIRLGMQKLRTLMADVGYP